MSENTRVGDASERAPATGGGARAPAAAAPRARQHVSPRRRAPRPLASALEELTSELAPVSLLGRVQTVWQRAAGATVAASASPASEREGVLTVLCESSVWAHELEMLAPELIASLNSELGSEAIVKLRCRTG